MIDAAFDAEQIKVSDKLLRTRGGVIWWKVGEGKTCAAVRTVELLRQEMKWSYPNICVVVLREVAFYDFRRELDRIGYDAVVLEHDTVVPDTVEVAMLQKPTFLLIAASKLIKSLPSLLVDPRIRAAIIDELYMYKNPTSQRSKAIQKLSLKVKAVGISGSIMTQRDITDVYGQLMAVQKHRYVAQNLTAFRGEFMNYEIVGAKDPNGKRWPRATPKPGAYKTIMERCAECTSVYFPPNERRITSQVLYVPPTAEQLRLFRELRKHYEAMDFGLELDTSLQVGLAIQRISNGFIVDSDENIRAVASNKPARLVSEVESLVQQGERAIIWCAFRYDVDMLTRLLREKGIATLQFMSGAPFPMDEWNEPGPKVCVATEAMGSSVNHFENVPYAFFYSLDYKWFDLQQAQGRTNRKGSRHSHCFYYFLQVGDSLDQAIYDRVLESRNRELTLIQFGEDVRNWLRKDRK